MRFCIVGSGAVGGYYGAKLAQAGHDVTFIARGAHLAAIRERGLTVKSQLGDFTVRAPAEDRAENVPPGGRRDPRRQDVQQRRGAADARGASSRDTGVALTLQNGVDSVDEVGSVVASRSRHRRHDVRGDRSRATGPHRADRHVSPDRLRRGFGRHGAGARIACGASTTPSRRPTSCRSRSPTRGVPIWEKFCYLAPFAVVHGRRTPADRADLVRPDVAPDAGVGVPRSRSRRAGRRRAASRRTSSIGSSPTWTRFRRRRDRRC